MSGGLGRLEENQNSVGSTVGALAPSPPPLHFLENAVLAEAGSGEATWLFGEAVWRQRPQAREGAASLGACSYDISFLWGVIACLH